MNKNYEPTYEGQLEKCQDERAGLERTVEELSDEIKQLRADLVSYEYQNAELVRNLAMAQDERDAARRMVCEWHGGLRVQHPQDYAERRGWDCFKNAPVVKTLNGVVVSKGKAVPPKFDLPENE